jgi:carboxyl-terminal processing protease
MFCSKKFKTTYPLSRTLQPGFCLMKIITERGVFKAALLFVLLIAPGITPPVRSAEVTGDDKVVTYKQLEIFSNVLSILQENYVEPLDTQEVINGAIQGMLFSLDPHSTYLPPESFKELQEDTSGSFSGIGIEVTIKDDQLTIVSPIADTPAARAGLKANDIIVEIEGVKTKDLDYYEAIKQFRGLAGSEITITIQRQGWSEPRKVTLKRDLIPVESVKAERLSPGLAYFLITNFQNHTSGDFKKKFDDLNKVEKIEGLILDLRNNPGGLLNQAVRISDLFLKSGVIVSTRGRRQENNVTFNAHVNSDDIHVPLIVVVNEGSASASEIVAGAIQDNKRGIIVGTRTFGKGSVQTIVPLPDGAGLKMTTARYYTPDNRSIQALGIMPDVEIPFIACAEPQDNTANGKKYIKEADLDNHLPGQSEAKQAGERQEQEMVNSKLLEDNQLRSAYNILKSLNLFSKYGGK